MKKEDIDSILVATKYLVLCKIEHPNNSYRYDLAKKYLDSKITQALSKGRKLSFS